jgi:hypothetical protein
MQGREPILILLIHGSAGIEKHFHDIVLLAIYGFVQEGISSFTQRWISTLLEKPGYDLGFAVHDRARQGPEIHLTYHGIFCSDMLSL